MKNKNLIALSLYLVSHLFILWAISAYVKAELDFPLQLFPPEPQLIATFLVLPYVMHSLLTVQYILIIFSVFKLRSALVGLLILIFNFIIISYIPNTSNGEIQWKVMALLWVGSLIALAVIQNKRVKPMNLEHN